MFGHFMNKKIAGKSFITYAISKDQGLEFVSIEKAMNGRQQEEHPLDCWSPQEAAKTAARKVGPRSYILHLGKHINNLKILVVGCQGSGNDAQKNIAELLHTIATSVATETDSVLVIFLGDNLYEYGAKSPTDPGFDERFHHLYYPSMRAFIVLGNHDANYHSKRVFDVTNPSGEEAELNEVAHTYLFHKSQDIETAFNIFSQDDIFLEDLSQWNMPYFFYTIIIPEVQKEIFIVDTNTYAKNFLHLQTNKNPSGGKNQAQWILEAYNRAKDAGRETIFMQHQPLYTCSRKKKLKPDIRHYLYPYEIHELNTLLGTETQSYNTLLTLIYEKQGMMPDFIAAAHDHFTSYYNNNDDDSVSYKIRQATLGGGGGKLQSRESLEGYLYVGCHFEKHGLGLITCSTKNTKGLLFEIFALKNDYEKTKNYFHLKFSNQNHVPIRNQTQDINLEVFRNEALPACFNFFKKLHKEEIRRAKQQGWYTFFSTLVTNVVSYVSPWTSDEAAIIKCVQDVMNYLNQFQLPNKEVVKNDLFIRLTEAWPKKDSFPQYINLCQQLLGNEIINHLMIAEQELVHHTKISVSA